MSEQYMVRTNFTAITDEDGGVSVTEGSDDCGYSFEPGFDYDAELVEQSNYLAAVVTAKRYAEQTEQEFFELRVAEAAKVLRKASSGIDSDAPEAADFPIPAMYVRQARAILAAIGEGLV